jgi:hypothetical protein
MVLPDPYTYADEVPDGHPYCGLPIVPSSKSILSLGLVVVGVFGAVVSAKLLE